MSDKTAAKHKTTIKTNACAKGATVSENNRRQGLPSVKFAPEAYARFVIDSGMTEEQQEEYLDMIWKIVLSFVDLGFGIESTQQAMEANTEFLTITRKKEGCDE